LKQQSFCDFIRLGGHNLILVLVRFVPELSLAILVRFECTRTLGSRDNFPFVFCRADERLCGCLKRFSGILSYDLTLLLFLLLQEEIVFVPIDKPDILGFLFLG